MSYLVCSADDRCRQPIRDECHILPERLWPIDEYSLVFWTYNPKTRVCMPNYSLNGIKNCPRNANLPKTKWECEELCGECTFHCRFFSRSDGSLLAGSQLSGNDKRGYYSQRSPLLILASPGEKKNISRTPLQCTRVPCIHPVRHSGNTSSAAHSEVV